MKTLRFQCPATSHEVDSGISAHRSARLVSIRARCPICEGLHEWRVADRDSCTVLPADPRANGARRANGRSALQEFRSPSAEIIELRDQLLDELNHRLKNNLQMLNGLLQAAARKTDNSEAREVLSDTSRRIGAMGSAQQIFYSVHSSTDVSAQEFLAAVCANAGAFLSKEVSINYQATAGSLPKETAVPLALVLNELITNAAKHGADDRGRVTVNVALNQRSGTHELRVHDGGRGFNLEEVRGRSSGLGLVTMLALRIKGTFTVERRSGACCTLSFPDQ